jgi:hypothetical protein
VSSCQKTERHAEKSYQRTSAGFMAYATCCLWQQMNIIIDVLKSQALFLQKIFFISMQ